VTQPAVLDEPQDAATAPHQRSHWWRLGIRPFRSWTLRSRIVLVVVALLAILSLIIGGLSILALSSYLMNRLDNQLTSAVDRGRHAADQFFGVGPTDQRVEEIVSVPGQEVGTFGAVISNGTFLYARLLAPTGSSKTVSANAAPVLALPSDGKPHTVDLGPQLGLYRLTAARLINGDEIIIGLPLTDVTDTVDQLILVIASVTIIGLILAGAVATLIVRRTLRPLERVANTAQEVSEMPLDHGDVALFVRVPDEDADTSTEVGKVGAAFNRMLGHVGSALSARQASEKKVRQFVADASHELRTPLASIRGYAELTRRSPHDLPSDVTRSIGRIESEATRMTSLVEDLLLLARLDEGRDLESEPVDLSILLVDAVSDAHAAGPEHHWSLDLPDEPVEVPGDAARLHQVVTNLLANARIHTPEGTDVTVALAATPAGGAVITVTDNGPGIDPELLPTLFERFARGDSSRSRATGSTGLGLAIVEAVVAAHGGSVAVSSEPGDTVFRVELPGEVANQQGAAAE
jgi:two-component system, OmpR family, sensor kinase